MHTCNCDRPLAQDPATTIGLLYGYLSGAVKIDGEWTLIPAGVVIVEDDDINYVELNPATAAVSANVLGFSSDRLPLAKVATIDGEIVSVVSWRPAFTPGTPGAVGAQGPVGPQGSAGDQGVAGPQGAQGVQGPAGEQGLTGPQGTPGAQGPAGETGPQGAEGPVGPQGSTGETGETGPQGPEGPAGATGVLHGNGAPVDGSTGIGVAGRMYMDDLTGFLYLNQGSLASPAWRGVVNR